MEQLSAFTDFFDGITRIAAAICPACTTCISFPGIDRTQHLSYRGDIDSFHFENDFFGRYCIQNKCTLNIADVRKDPLFTAIPAVVNQAAVISYAGIPLRAPGGNVLGILSVIGQQPMLCSGEQMLLLQTLADQALSMILERKEKDALKNDIAVLKKTNALFEQANKVACIGAWEVDLVNNSIYWSAVTREIHGVSAAYVPDLQNSINFYKEGDSREKISHAVSEAILHHIPFDEELEIIPLNGLPVWVRVKGDPVVEDGQCIRIYGTFQDIQQQREQQQILEGSEQKYRSIIENSPAATLLTNPADGTILDCNEAASAMFGYTYAELKMQKRENIIDVNDPNYGLLAGIRNQQGKVQGELTGIRKNGEHFPLLYSSAFFKGSDGQIRASMSGIDISAIKKAEQALMVEKETLANVIEGTDAAVWEWNIQTGETVYNERWAEMLGYTLADLQPINKYTWPHLAHPADRKIAYRLMEACFNKETEYYDCEYRMKHKDGHWVWVLDRGKVISYTPDKKPLKMFGIHLDITTRKNVVEALRQKQALLETVMDTIDVGIAACDANGAITLFNKAARDLHGLPPDFIPSADWADFFDLCQPDCITPLAENEIPLAATLVGGDIHNVEVAIVPAKGQVRFLSVNGQQIKDVNGSVTGAVVALHEITDRKKAEQLLAFSERRFKGIFNSTFSFIGFLAPDGTLLEANETILRFSGVHPELVVNQKLWDCYWGQTSPEEQEKLKGKIGRAAKGEFLEYELEIESRQGKKMTILFNLKPLFDDDGKVIAIVSEGRPIQEIVDARKSLQEKNAELEQFAFIASHDLKEPLRMVHSFMHLLRDNYGEQLDAKANKYIGFAIDGSARMTEMVNQLLSYARVGSNEAERELIDTNQLLKGILALQQAVLEEKGAVVQASKLPEIYGVRTPLVLLFQNLITNAIKYQAPGTNPVVLISARETSRNYQFAIQDNGIGIAAKHHQEIFQLFKRLHTKQEFAGTGMGLATCKKIVEQHGGKIWVESEEGKGSTFYFTIKKSGAQLQ